MSSNTQRTNVNAQAPQSSSKKFAARVFAYNKQVRCDRKLPSAAKVIAAVIADHWNEESGEAHPSTSTIAKEAGLSQPTVRRMLPNLVERGHVAITFGSRGSGHPNRYWPMEKEPLKETTASQSIEPKTSQLKIPPERPIEPFSPSIETSLSMNTLEHTSGPPGPRSVPVESLVVKPVTMRAPEGAHANPVEREKPEMLTPEQKAAVAELLQDRWTPRELADAAGCPDDVPVMAWLAQHGLAERAGNAWKFRNLR
jgi:DNA-binding transcriptional regulator YhcF (GntR family)